MRQTVISQIDFLPRRRGDSRTAARGIVLAFLVASVCLCASNKTAPYGSRVTFHANSTIHFADFDLIFLGTHRVTPRQYPRGWVVYEFRAVHAAESVPFSWSEGTGLIGPAAFTISGHRFFLELKHSDRLGMLKEDELVISRAPGTD